MTFRSNISLFNQKNLELQLDGGLNGKFVFNIKDVIGKGRFRKVFKGRNIYTFDEIAIKTEPISSTQLYNEVNVYTILGAKNINHNIQGLPVIYHVDNIGVTCTAIVMELLGPSLDELFERCGRKMSLKTVLAIAVQMVSRLEYVHKHGLIHTDIKPGNVLVGRPQQSLPYKDSTENIVFLTNYGMSKFYIDPKNKLHIPFNEKVGVFRTYQFMSANNHFKNELSRRDDLESLGYMLLYLVTGTLPWLQSQEYKFDLIKCGIIKKTITTKNLCQSLPDEFTEYFDYVKQLQFTETPDYERIKSLFYLADERNTLPNEKAFNWSTE